MSSASVRDLGRSGALLVVTLLILAVGFGVQAWRARMAASPALAETSADSLSFALEDVTSDAGIVHRHVPLAVHDSIAHVDKFITGLGGAAVAVFDYNNDGLQDIYLTTMAIGELNRLFENQGDGTFRDVAADVGLADVNRDAGSLRPIFFDFENDGDRDLVLTTTFCPRVFRNDNGRFVDITSSSGITHCGFASASNAFDFDRDGDQDLVVADFFRSVDLRDPSSHKIMPNGWFSATNGGPINVYRNNGDATFTRVSDNLGLDAKEWRGWVHAIGTYDIQGRGGTDLYFAVDFNLQDRLFYDAGAGVLQDVSSQLEQKYSHSSMSSEIADFRNIDLPSIFVSHIYAPGWVPARNILWDIRKQGAFHDAGAETGVATCGWAWGAKFGDLDNDGWQDLVVANGYFSGDPTRDYWYQTALLQGGHSALAEDARQWPPLEGRSMASNQRSCVFANRNGRFVNVTEKTGMFEDLLDGRGLATIDLLGDGSLSLVVANFDQPARLFRNRQQNDNNWIGFSLIGTRSGTDAFGTKVTLRLDGDVGMKLMTRELRPLNGYVSQSDPRLHFGLGKDAKIRSITVRWPSGLEQELPGLALNRYHEIHEPTAAGTTAS